MITEDDVLAHIAALRRWVADTRDNCDAYRRAKEGGWTAAERAAEEVRFMERSAQLEIAKAEIYADWRRQYRQHLAQGGKRMPEQEARGVFDKPN